jgi:nitrogenase molybdenum-iron protein alpha/beta subunit
VFPSPWTPHCERHGARLGLSQDQIKTRKTAKLQLEATPYDVAIIGDYNIGGDAWASRILLEELGLRVVAQWSGDGTINEMMQTPNVKMNSFTATGR